MIECVTFTGIDERTDLERAARIGTQYGWAEFAVLAGSRTGQERRFPGHDVLHRMSRLQEETGTRTALHLCGRWSRRLLAREYVAVADACVGFGRVQVNLPAEDRWTGIDHCAELALRTGKRVIIQHGHGCPGPDRWTVFGVDRLWDRSGGTGRETIDEWPPPPAGSTARHGYAGGLGPENIGRAVEFAEWFPEARIWLDMESGVRTGEDWLDLDAVEAVCEQVAQRIGAKASAPAANQQWKHPPAKGNAPESRRRTTATAAGRTQPDRGNRRAREYPAIQKATARGTGRSPQTGTSRRGRYRARVRNHPTAELPRAKSRTRVRSMPVFILAWHPAGAPRRRYQVQVCDDVSRAAELAAGLARSDGGGRWVVFGTVTRTRRNGSTATERDAVVAKGTEPPTAGGNAADTVRPARRGRRGATRR